MRTTSQENLTLLAKLLIRHAPMGVKEAVRELLKIDFIKNNYSKNTIFNYLVGVRTLLKDKKISRYMSKELAQEVIRIENINMSERKDTPILNPIKVNLPTTIQEKKKTHVEEILEIEEKIKKLEMIIEQKKNEYEKKREDMLKAFEKHLEEETIAEEVMNKKLVELHSERFRVISEKISKEIKI